MCCDTASEKSDDTELSASNLGTRSKSYDQSFGLDNDLAYTFKEGIVFDGFYTEEAIESIFDTIIEWVHGLNLFLFICVYIPHIVRKTI